MISIFLYLLVQFNISTSDGSSHPAETPPQYVQSAETGRGDWEDGD